MKNRKTAFLCFCFVSNVWKELLSILYNPDRMQRKVFFLPTFFFSFTKKRTLIKSPFLVLLDGCRNLPAFWRPRLHSSSYFCKDRRQSELNTPQILFWRRIFPFYITFTSTFEAEWFHKYLLKKWMKIITHPWPSVSSKNLDKH